jgi:hypothetical protein
LCRCEHFSAAQRNCFSPPLLDIHYLMENGYASRPGRLRYENNENMAL